MSKRRKHRIKLQSVYVWHRYLGLSAALFVILLSGSGLLLNHSNDLDLKHRFLSSPLLLSWYGIKAPDKTVSFVAGRQTFTQMGKRLYCADAALAGEYSSLLGAVISGEMLVVAADNTLLLLTAECDLIERISEIDGVPQDLAAIGLDAAGRPAVKAGQTTYRPDSDWLRWSPDEDVLNIAWASPQQIPVELRERIQQQYLGNGLSMERVLLDLHSGRIFTRAGRGVADAIAILLIALALTGVWTGLKRRR